MTWALSEPGRRWRALDAEIADAPFVSENRLKTQVARGADEAGTADAVSAPAQRSRLVRPVT